MVSVWLKLNRLIKESFRFKALKTFFICISMFTVLTNDIFYQVANAQTLQQSMKYYFKGDLNATETSLNQTLRNKISDKDRSQAYKYLGIVQFMKGKKDQATTNFRSALGINPKIGIAASEALDESVIPFFNSIKADKSKYIKAARPSSGGRVAPKATTSGVRSVASKAKRTTLFIRCNVKSATVMIGGILAGSVNSVLDVNPGKQKIEVSSPGYITKRVNVNIVQNNENSITIDLSKPQPKPKPIVAKAQAPKVVKAPKSRRMQSSGMNLQQEYGQDMSQNQYYGNQGMQPQVPQNPYQQYAPSNQYMPNMYQAPMYQTPMYQYPSPMYSSPTPMYQQPQMMQPAPSYQSPQSDLYSYQQESYDNYNQNQGSSSSAPSSSISAPPSPPSSDSYSEAENYNDFNLDDKPVSKSKKDLSKKKVKISKKQSKDVSYYYDDPGGKSSKGYASYYGSSKKKKKSSSSSLGILRFLPFGVPQFVQGKVVWGIIFGGAQAGGLGWGIYEYIQYSDCVKNCQAQIDELYAQEYDPESIKAYADYLEEQKQQHNTYFKIGMGIFAGAWVLGILETIINPPKASSKKSAYIIEKNTYHLLATDDKPEDPYLRSTSSVLLDEIAQETSMLEDLYSYRSTDILTEDKPKVDEGLKILPTDLGSSGIPLIEYKFSF